jgi:hypothetical protein
MGEQPSYKKCPKCGKRCEQTIFAPYVATSGMSQAPLDVVIGRDAEKRWDRIHERQGVRDKVRKESGKAGLTKVGQDEYKSHDRPLDFVPTRGK